MNNKKVMLPRFLSSVLSLWVCLMCSLAQATVCSTYVNDMTINEVYELGNDAWVEVRLLDDSISSAVYQGWSLRLCEEKKGCEDYSLADKEILYPATFPNHLVLSVDAQYANLNKTGGMDALLLDASGKCIDYLSVNGFSDHQPSCAGFAYPTATGALDSSLKGIYRDADGTGPWYQLASAGATGEPTKGKTNAGLTGTVDHYRIEHPASALTCHTAEITVRACANTDCSSYYTETVDLVLTPASGWIGGNEPSFSGGSGIFQLRRGSSGNVTLDLSANPAPAGANRCYVGGVGSDCTITFYDAGFLLNVPDLTSCQSNATPFIQAVRKDNDSEACVADGGFANQTKVVGFWIDYLQPATGSMVSSLNGTPLATASPGSPITLTFDAEARSTFALVYDDAGQLQLNALYEGSGEEAGLIMAGSDSFVVAPYALRVLATSDGTSPLDNTTSSGTPFWQAGEDFYVEVAGVCSGGTVTPNFAADTGLSAISPFSPATGSIGTLGGGSLVAADYSAGIAVDSSVSYSEVGNVTIHAAAANYLGSGIAVEGDSAPVGRFTPHHFAVSLNTPVFATACASGSFTYLGQPFDYAVAPVITVTAQNKQDGVTQNYFGDWWKITSGAGGSLTGNLYNAAMGSINISNVPVEDPTVSVLGGGMGLLTFAVGDGLFFERSDPLAPFDADISLDINVLDSDGIAHAVNPVRFGEAVVGNGIAFDAGKGMRWGRVVLNNAYGSELLPLVMPLRAEYFDGTAFVFNSGDSCTSLPVTQLSLSNGSGTVTGNNPIAVGSGTTSATLIDPLLAGDANLSFSSPGDEGYVDVTADLSLSDWLRFDWDGDGSHDNDPQGRATFGIYKGRPSIIYQRETYR